MSDVRCAGVGRARNGHRKDEENKDVVGIDEKYKRYIKKTYASGEVLMWYSQLATFPSF